MAQYVVNLVRCVFQTVAVNVEAESEEEAREKALTDRLPNEKQWTGKFEPHRYSPFVATVVAADEDEDEDEDGAGEGPFEDVRFALLQADLFSGEGWFLPQRWMSNVDELMLADISKDWAEETEQLQESSLEEFHNWLREQRPTAVIIPFPGKPDTED